MNETCNLRQVTERSEILCLAARIKEDFPYCISMYNNLLMNGRGYNRSFQYRFYVPADHPDSHIVIWMKMTEPRDMSIHCTEEESSLVIRLTQSTDFLDLLKENPVELSVLPDYLTSLLSKTLSRDPTGISKVYPNSTFTYVSLQDVHLRCPKGLKVRRLNKAGIHHLLQMSQYNKGDSIDSTVLLTNNLPALGFYVDPSSQEESIINLDTLEFAGPDELIPVSWIGMYHYGSFGMLRTNEAYRGRGLASILIEMMGRLLLMDGYFPHAHVEPDNDASLKLFGNLSGWKDTYCSYWIDI